MKTSPFQKRSRTSSCLDLRTFKSASTETGRQYQTDLFSGLYKGKNISQQLTLSKINKITHRGTPMDLQNIIKLKTKCGPKLSLTVQQLQQQNQQLKMTLNEYKQTISKLKVELNLSNKRNQQSNEAMLSQLDYYNDIYWPKDMKNHRIQGMKLQYNKFKKQYAEKEKQLQATKLLLTRSQIPELTAYIKQLQKQNARLLKIIQTNNLQQSQTSIQAMNTQKHQQYCLFLKNQIQKNQKIIKQKNAKIIFLQKIFIQKDNKFYSTSKKQKKLQKIIQTIQNQNYVLNENINFFIKKQEIHKIKMKRQFEQDLRIDQKKWKKIIKQKDNKIVQLQENIKILESTLHRKDKNLHIRNNILSGNSRKLNTQFGNNLILTQQKQLKSQTRKLSSQYNQQNLLFQHIAYFSQKNLRSPKKGEEKNQNCIVLKKIQFKDVQPIGNLLKYRLISLGISQAQMKQFFVRQQTDKSQKAQSILNSQKGSSILGSAKSEKVRQLKPQKEEQNIYINIREATKILKSYPFNLEEEQSLTLARYLIEDGSQGYVYYQQTNQNLRQIVKSIMRTLLGQYTLAKSAQFLSFNKQFISRFGSNLRIALQTYYPHGRVSKQKFIQVVKSTGGETSQRQMQMMIGKMAMHSSSLNQLNYTYLFQAL